MIDISSLRKGLSLGFLGGPGKETFDTCKKYGIDCVEFSSSYHDTMQKYRFLENAALYADQAAEAGVELWSFHLPFSAQLDISSPIDEDRELTMSIHEKFIRACRVAGMKTVVLHPSSEPISQEERPSRLKRSRGNIMILAELCEQLSLNLAVENLPRTCLCNQSDEMLELLTGTHTTVCFDTNHSLLEKNEVFLRNIIDGGLKVSTLHISDYDFVDERHWLPGVGVGNWRAVIALLENADYSGPLLYEVSEKREGAHPISMEALAENQRKLASKEMI